MTGGGGGFIPGIIFNTSEPNLIYARTDIGGAYRWDQGTGTWKQLLNWVGMDDWSKSGVDALATDPVDPDRLYLAVGTYTNSWDPDNGRILRSTDRGETWEETELPFKVGGNMPGRSLGERLAIDPNKNSVLYFGARSGNGLWKSTDYGETWSKVNQFPNPGTYVENPDNEYQSDITGLAWITFDPATGSRGQATQTITSGWRIRMKAYTDPWTEGRPGRRLRDSRAGICRITAFFPPMASCILPIATAQDRTTVPRARCGS
ncbi:hypothetical protein HMSSN036_40970 [Paenibacillus macerans]|nr:hypothetical protein HMSSN036_40970 [Paenibacillus macerans]